MQNVLQTDSGNRNRWENEGNNVALVTGKP